VTEELRRIQAALGERQGQIGELDRAIARALEAAAEAVANGEPLDVAAVTAARVERAVVADELRVMVRAAEIASRAARDAEHAAKLEAFRADPRPLQTIGPYAKPGFKIPPLT
jgi:hypothetical protein